MLKIQIFNNSKVQSCKTSAIIQFELLIYFIKKLLFISSIMKKDFQVYSHFWRSKLFPLLYQVTYELCHRR